MSIQERFNLSGRRALVTGASQGIGRSIALALAEFGADVMVHCGHDTAKADAVRAEVERFGVRAGVVTAALGAPTVAADIVGATRAAIGDPDILVLNASVQIRRPWHQITADEYRRQIDVNFGSSLWLAQAAVPAMRQRRWGRILTIGSIQQVRPHPDMLVYAATKSALVNFVLNLAPQLAGDGITVNNLAPGVIATPRNDAVLSDPAYRDKVLAKIPLRSVGDPEDCAAAAVLLCSEAGRYITGQDLFVDGGMGLRA